MFKKGDNVKCISNSACGAFKKGNTYTVIDCKNGDIFVDLDDLGSNTNGWSIKRFELVTAMQTTTPQVPEFKVGDRVRLTHHYNDHYMPKGHEFTIAEMPTKDLVKGKCIQNIYFYTVETRYLELILPQNSAAITMDQIRARGVAISKPKVNLQVKPCSCDSMELFRKGCLCGAVVKQQWGLRE